MTLEKLDIAIQRSALGTFDDNIFTAVRFAIRIGSIPAIHRNGRTNPNST